MNACKSGKKAFATAAAAHHALEKLLARPGNKRRTSEGKSHVYVCPICKKRHIGHTTRTSQ